MPRLSPASGLAVGITSYAPTNISIAMNPAEIYLALIRDSKTWFRQFHWHFPFCLSGVHGHLYS